ncbi:GNAT family N-acetyltransferase [Mailhella massiliensis]|uniref:GNAT family N-acetyltransferase n=1 Tax=Mailhella massiliensis TaxID=1903261 RepID=UPI002355231D|nr:GNAT family N-acetyltransferase [Mailhella massiliensis]
MILETSRVRLRPWEESDLAPFRTLNADPAIMRFFPAPLTHEESDALAASLQERMQRNGFGLWALELPGIAPFAGFIGLNVPSFNPSLVEIGWRMHKNFWGRGFATEGAALAMEAGFSLFSLKDICSFTATLNTPSQRVMQRLGMEHRPEDDFNHPSLPPDHRLSRHVLYRMSKKRWGTQKERFPFLRNMRVTEKTR